MIEILAGLTPEYRKLQIASLEIVNFEQCLLRLEQEISVN
jgi:hypothetical protein